MLVSGSLQWCLDACLTRHLKRSLFLFMVPIFRDLDSLLSNANCVSLNSDNLGRTSTNLSLRFTLMRITWNRSSSGSARWYKRMSNSCYSYHLPPSYLIQLRSRTLEAIFLSTLSSVLAGKFSSTHSALTHTTMSPKTFTLAALSLFALTILGATIAGVTGQIQADAVPVEFKRDDTSQLVTRPMPSSL